MRRALVLLVILFMFQTKAWSMEFLYDGDKSKLKETIEWAENEADRIVASGLVDEIYRDALVSGIVMNKLQDYSVFRGIVYTDKDVNDIKAFLDYMRKKPIDLLEPVGHKYVGSTVAANYVKMVTNRAKVLFNDDGPQNWNIPKAQQDPSRKYTVNIR